MTDAYPPREIASKVESLGGTLLVAGVYWVAYLRVGRGRPSASP